MEQRLANIWQLTINEKAFIKNALLSDLRVDGRRLFDYRRLTIKFGREDGSSEVQLGQTHVMGFVTSQLVQPYRERPNEGTLSIFTEFSPMADPSFEAGRPGESSVELGRVIDRGLRESRSVDTESLCVIAGKLVWAIRVDLHILDNGGNLVDAANIAALAALLTFRRPECTVGGEDGQEVTVHPPEVIDPTHNEETVMGGRMTVIMNASGDVCAVQKAGGEGVMQSSIMQCMRIASLKAADITSKIKNAVEAYSTERALRKVKRHSSLAAIEVDGPEKKPKDHRNINVLKNEVDESLRSHETRFKVELDRTCSSESDGTKLGASSSQQADANQGGESHVFDVRSGESCCRDPYSKGIAPDSLRNLQVSTGSLAVDKEPKEAQDLQMPDVSKPEEATGQDRAANSAPMDASEVGQHVSGKKNLRDAVKRKDRRRK